MEIDKFEKCCPCVVVAPTAGFCNRLQTMCAAIKYAQRIGMKLCHVWDGQPFVCHFPHEQQIQDRGFHYFFDSPLQVYQDDGRPIATCYTKWFPGSFWWPSQCYGADRCKSTIFKDFREIPESAQTESFLIQQTLDVPISNKEKHEIYCRYFQPTSYFLQQLFPFSTPPIGIHIRKLDFYCYFPDSSVPDEFLSEWLHSFQEPVLLFSDDAEFQTRMRLCLANPVSCTFETESKFPEDLAFLTFLSLSRCSQVYGTKESSFSYEASVYGNVPHENITTDLCRNVRDNLCL
jgi:hypothetical protein